SWRTTPAPAVLTGSAATGAYFDYVLVIIMENHNLCDVLESCGGAATYLSGFASSYGLATQDLYCSVHPSLPNYLCLSGASDFGSTLTASNYMWLTPNIQNDMHSSSIQKGDTYMSVLVPQILDSAVFKTKKAALYVTFDEGTSTNPSPIYTVWAGPAAKTGYSSSFGYNHFSFLATVEANWNLANLTANDRDAPNLTEFFVGQPSRGVSVP